MTRMRALQYCIGIFSLAAVLLSCGAMRTLAKHSSFNLEQTKMIMAEDSSLAMRVWKINDLEDSLLLRQKSFDVDYYENDVVLNSFINRLYKTVVDSVNAGVGIAAPQVGILKNIIWVQRFDKIGFPFEVYINPIITYYSEEKQPCTEGCLSIPNRSDSLNIRSMDIDIDYINGSGKKMKERVSGFTAVIFQHEIDHLNGLLYTDYLE